MATAETELRRLLDIMAALRAPATDRKSVV